MSDLSSQWRSLDAAQKAAYVQKAESAKGAAEAERERHIAALAPRQRAILDLLSANGRVERGTKTRRSLSPDLKLLLEELPKPPASSGRALFFKERMPAVIAAQNVAGRALFQAMPTIMRQTSSEWAALSEAERSKYNEKVKSERAKFEQALDAFVKARI